MTETATTEKPKVEKPKTYCLVTGRETKRGKFAPGQDAVYVSQRVAEAAAGQVSREDAAARILNETGSVRLVEKFGKQLDNKLARLAKVQAAQAS